MAPGLKAGYSPHFLRPSVHSNWLELLSTAKTIDRWIGTLRKSWRNIFTTRLTTNDVRTSLCDHWLTCTAPNYTDLTTQTHLVSSSHAILLGRQHSVTFRHFCRTRISRQSPKFYEHNCMHTSTRYVHWLPQDSHQLSIDLSETTERTTEELPHSHQFNWFTSKNLRRPPLQGYMLTEWPQRQTTTICGKNGSLLNCYS